MHVHVREQGREARSEGTRRDRRGWREGEKMSHVKMSCTKRSCMTQFFFNCMGEKERGKRRKTYSILSTLHALTHTPEGTRRATVAKKEEEEERGEVDREEKITHHRILFHFVREMKEWERRKEVEIYTQQNSLPCCKIEKRGRGQGKRREDCICPLSLMGACVCAQET